MTEAFNLMIIGRTGCGKTRYMLDMLEKDYFGYFDYIFLICPTYFWNKTYQNWKYKDSKKFYPLPCKQDSVEKILKYIVEIYKGTNSLIILDDCAAIQTVKNRTSELVKVAFHAKHYELSSIVITQQMTSIAKPYRENATKLLTFYNPSRKDMKAIVDEFLGDDITKEECEDIIRKLRNNKYVRLEILACEPYTHQVIGPLGKNERANFLHFALHLGNSSSYPHVNHRIMRISNSCDHGQTYHA